MITLGLTDMKVLLSFSQILTLIWWTAFNSKNCAAFHKARKNGATEKEAFDYANILK